MAGSCARINSIYDHITKIFFEFNMKKFTVYGEKILASKMNFSLLKSNSFNATKPIT